MNVDQTYLRRRILLGLGLVVGLAFSSFAALAASEATIVQSDRTFHPDEIEIAKDTLVHFANEDEFIHQIYVKSEKMNFDSAEQVPGKTIDLVFSETGTFKFRCHIHPKMRLTVIVK
jgi:plastocyanin